jgi:hypothetical protein
MKNDIRDYMVLHKGYFSKEFCAETIRQLSEVSHQFENHAFYHVRDGSSVSHDDDFKVFFGSIKNTDTLVDAVRNLSIEYANEFDITPLQGFTHPRFNIYTPGTNMKNHIDHIHGIFDGTKKGIPIMSMLMALNEDYEGGELVFFHDEPYHIGTGDVLIFPSNFVYPHKVNTITGGTRYSVISWVY